MSEFKAPELIDVSTLRFDPKNPRFSESAEPMDEEEILTKLQDEWVLGELTYSMLDHGYFAQEPLLVLDEPDAEGRLIVLEGNRRLAALKLLLERGGDHDPPPSQVQLERLRSVPCIRVADRSSVWAYLGFRHIGGIKEWSPSAKARFVTEAVERAWKVAPNGDPFKSVGRSFGSNAMGIRSAFIALAILRHARDEAGIPTSSIFGDRFGVWTRLLNSPELRTFIGFADAKSYPDILAAVQNLNIGHLAEVLADLTEQAGAPALLRDSRQATEYGRVLANDRARAILRSTRDLNAAAMMIQDVSLVHKLTGLARQLRALREEVSELPAVTGELAALCKEISSDARTMWLDVNERASQTPGE